KRQWVSLVYSNSRSFCHRTAKGFTRDSRSDKSQQMSAIPRKVTERLVAAIKKFQPILSASKARDDGEADTSMIITDMLAEVFGYDKFSEVTAEHAIRGTYCDLATKLDGAVQSLIQVTAIGLELKDLNEKQAVDYGVSIGSCSLTAFIGGFIVSLFPS